MPLEEEGLVRSVAGGVAGVGTLYYNASTYKVGPIDKVSADPGAVHEVDFQIHGLARPSSDSVVKVCSAAKPLNLKWVPYCRTTTSAPISSLVNSAPRRMSGVDLKIGDRILVKNQTKPEENGIWEFQSATRRSLTWSRVRFSKGEEERAGMSVVVTEGDYAGTAWTIVNLNPRLFYKLSGF